jgi:hypothetical protein
MPASARDARRFVCTALESLGRDALVDDAASCVAELAANAVLHARGPFYVRVTKTNSGARVEVIDFSTGDIPLAMPRTGIAADVTAESSTGRGLQVVAAVAARWGIDVGPASKSVWVELEPGRAVAPTEPIVSPGPSSAREGSPSLRFLAVPVRLALASGLQVEEVVRELQLGVFDDAVSDRERGEFYSLLDRSAPLRLAGRRAAVLAANRGDERFDMQLAVDDDMVAAVNAFRDVVEALPRREGESTARPSDDVIAFRAWLQSEVAAQLAGSAPSPCPLPG